MLTWEEEASPQSPASLHATISPPPAAASATPSTRVLDDGAVVANKPSAPPPATTQTTDSRRVNAADKRIINGQTDVNQLVPFKYKWAW